MTLKKLSPAVALSALLAFGYAPSASAVTVTNDVTIKFDDSDGTTTGGQPKTYTSQGYQFTPVNINNDTKCDEGACTKESTQTGLPEMTRVDSEHFSLNSFYFALVGQGNGGNSEANEINAITVSAFTDLAGTISAGSPITLTLDDVLADYSGFSVTATVPAPTNAACTDPTADSSEVLCKNRGYVVDVSQLSTFQNVKNVKWTATDTAQALIDTVSASTMAPIPLPAGAWLLITGLGALGFARRRKA